MRESLGECPTFEPSEPASGNDHGPRRGDWTRGPMSVNRGEHRWRPAWPLGTPSMAVFATVYAINRHLLKDFEFQRRTSEKAARTHTCRDQALTPWRRSPVWSSVTFWHTPFSTGESPASSALCPCTGHGSSLLKVVSGHAASSPAPGPWTPAPTGVSSVGGAHPGEGPTLGRGPPQCPAAWCPMRAPSLSSQ